ncbi:DUF2690 domain-containing protein [Streptomyces sp. NPDC004296]|uniref:helix-turn-helix domain-containing protein n=1 Tax=Streptomyces sp. NPDC004296 TaxID=3364697 RepID=UPI0036A47BCB
MTDVAGSAWRTLPPSLDPQVAHLVTVLRELKDRSGLSLNTLAAETAHSRSSWNRYLNGGALPPRNAVEMLGRLAGEPPERLVALWTQAEERYSGRDAEPAPAGGFVEAASQDAASPSPATDRAGWTDCAVAGRRFRLVVIAVAVLAAFAWAGIRLLGPRGTVPPAGLEPGAFSPVPLTVGCRERQCTGLEAGAMACDVDAASYAAVKTGPSRVEVRMSRNCAAAWARISYSSVGDHVSVQTRSGTVEMITITDDRTTDQYVVTHMVPASSPTQVRACWEPHSGGRQCTPWGQAAPVVVR